MRWADEVHDGPDFDLSCSVMSLNLMYDSVYFTVLVPQRAGGWGCAVCARARARYTRGGCQPQFNDRTLAHSTTIHARNMLHRSQI